MLETEIDELIRAWETNIEYLEPFSESDEYELTNASIAREALYKNYDLLTEQQKKKLKEIDQKALEIYYRNVNNQNKNMTQLIFESIVEDYILDKDRNR